MKEKKPNIEDSFTASGTNIDEVKRQNEHSGLTYNQAKALLANRTICKVEENNSVPNMNFLDEGN